MVYTVNEIGIHAPPTPITHREDEFYSEGFDDLLHMQDRHFWYLGRHRFLLAALKRTLKQYDRAGVMPDAVDLGGGVGGWIKYLCKHTPGRFGELALADSSQRALTLARDRAGLPVEIGRYQIDLLNLQWSKRWDIAFLLDVLEHIPQDVQAMQQIRESLKPGGTMIVTTPALKRFWSYNDDLTGHVRRYSRRDFAELAAKAGLELVYSRYFMFFLSPLYFLSRWRSPDASKMTQEQIRQMLADEHRVPSWPINQMLRGIFSVETPLGLWLAMPWGTSVLGVFRRAE